MSNDLLPCPFCGCEAHVRRALSVVYQKDDSKDYCVECMNPNCWVQGKECNTEAEATAHWNKRPRLQIVMSYDPQGTKGILGIKFAKDEAEKVQARWAEIVEGSDIEEWAIGEELEPEA